jgi:hypothetical protein
VATGSIGPSSHCTLNSTRQNSHCQANEQQIAITSLYSFNMINGSMLPEQKANRKTESNPQNWQECVNSKSIIPSDYESDGERCPMYSDYDCGSSGPKLKLLANKWSLISTGIFTVH